MLTRADLVLLLLVALALPGLYLHYWQNGSSQQARILADEQLDRIVPLFPDRTIEVNGRLGDSVLEIRDGRIRFRESPCRNRACIHQGWLSQAGQTAACLPNRVSVQLLGADPRFDAINF